MRKWSLSQSPDGHMNCTTFLGCSTDRNSDISILDLNIYPNNWTNSKGCMYKCVYCSFFLKLEIFNNYNEM